MSINQFFETPKEQSVVKATIVKKYFGAWAKVVMKHSDKIAYFDLFAGPGYYEDGTPSTPLLILETAIQDIDMRQKLVTVFNDKEKKYCQALEQAVNALPDITTLKYPPQVYNYEVGDEIVQIFEQTQLVPTLLFVDPLGYKGLSLRLVKSVLKNWGCDCIFFFNYNRINMGLENLSVKEHMDALFGSERADVLRIRLEPMSPSEREFTIVEEIAQALKEVGGRYVLPFRFRDAKGNRTSHHLIFVTKNFTGYGIMKEIMATESSITEQGVPSFEYNRASERQPLLFELTRPLDDLGEMLLADFAGLRATMKQIYEEHSVDKPYIAKNYKDVLVRLEAEGRIEASPPVDKRKKRKGKVTFGDNVLVTFPPRRL